MDSRKKKIIYVSGCILNQNLRFPGIAIRPGAINELVAVFLKNDIGIEQLPCLECLGWGGVSRNSFFKYMPLFVRYYGSKRIFLLKLFAKIWIWKYKRLCKKEAKIVVNNMVDFIQNDYIIIGIIAMNDSPTCGLTKTINLLNSAKLFKELGYNLNDFLNPEFEKMKTIIPHLCEDGTGFFMAEILKEIKKKKLKIDVLEFNPWNDINKENERLINFLKSKLITEKK
jgi:predicted secreted protein